MIEFTNGMELSRHELTPGNVISFERMEDLPPFEDEVAFCVKPQYDPIAWRTRTVIVEAWRIPDLHSRLTDIRLRSMANPYANLLQGEGMHISSGMNGFKSDGPDRKFFDENTIGFDFSALANGVPVCARLFFVPLNRGRRKIFYLVHLI